MPETLLHSDVHLGNWYQTRDGRMGQHDWQAVCRGGGAVDLAYALSAGLAVDDRRAWERDLVRHYLDRLAARGAPEVPTFDQAWLTYRQQMLRALNFWLYTIGRGALQPDMQPLEVSEAHVECTAAAVIDHGSIGLVSD